MRPHEISNTPILALFAVASVHGAVVLTIDISNPSAVVFTSVANHSQITGNLSVDFSGGISVRDFFTQNEFVPGSAIVGDWKSRGADAQFNEMATFVFDDPAVVPGVSLSIYYSTPAPTDDQNLLATEAPFTGSSIVNMEDLVNLPDVGTTGDVHLGYLSSQGGVIGQWQVIPEPSAAILGTLGMTFLLRRRR